MLKKSVTCLIVLLSLAQFIQGLELEILEENQQSLEKEGNRSEISKTYEWDKPSLNDITLNYPEIKPGRPITGYLIVGLVFITLTITPYLLYSLYLLLTPAPLRPNIREILQRQKRQLFHYEPESWYKANEYNSIQDEKTRSECLEKIICRIEKRANDFGVGDLLEVAVSGLSRVRPSWKWRMARGRSSAGRQCNFYCDPLKSVISDLKKLFALPPKVQDEAHQYLDSSY